MTAAGRLPVEDAAVDLAVDLVRTPSVNPALSPGAGGERAVVELLSARLSAAGFAVEVLRPRGLPERPSLLAMHPGRGGGRSLLLNGHLDTVGTEGMADPFAGRIEGDRLTGRLLGRGACDMKAGVAALVTAAEVAAARGTRGDVTLALVADEEHASVGTETVLDRLTARGRLPDACIVAEPTWLDLVVAHRGYALVEVDLQGRAAHSSQPEQGVNAVTHLGRLLAAVERRHREIAAGPAHPVVGTGSLMATVARGGTSAFVLAGSAHAVLERRVVPGEPASLAVAEVQQLLDALRRADAAVEGRARETLAREAWEVDESARSRALLDLLAEHLSATGRPAPARVGAPYWMESALWQQAGISTVVCGPAGGGLHAADEWVDLAQVRDYARALTGVVTAFCG